MRLLLITQVVDARHPVQGYMSGWIAAFARRFERVTVICLQKGEETGVPGDVKVVSLGKERRASRLRYVLSFYRAIWRERRQYDAVYVHMNQVYVILGAPVWKLLGKRVVLWYAHGSVSPSLRLATLLADRVLTSTPEGFRIRTPKLRVIGQGIDTERFAPRDAADVSAEPLYVSVGRISPSKDYETTLRAFRKAVDAHPAARLVLVGGPGTPAQEEYLAEMQGLARDLGIATNVEFAGPLPHDRIREYLAPAWAFVSTGTTGSLDKTLVEAAMTGLPVIASTEAVAALLDAVEPRLRFPARDAIALADRMLWLAALPLDERTRIGGALRARVADAYGLEGYVARVYDAIAAIR